MINPLAPKWDRAVDGLDLRDCMRRAREFERSRLPSGIVFPREGQIWRAVRDCEIGFMAWFMKAPDLQRGQAPFFPCGIARLSRGEEVRILALDDPRPLTVSFVPVCYAELQEDLVPEHVRRLPGYSHYQLTAPTARTFGIEKRTDYFTDCFQLMEATTGAS